MLPPIACSAVAVCSAQSAERKGRILSGKFQKSRQILFCDADLWMYLCLKGWRQTGCFSYSTMSSFAPDHPTSEGIRFGPDCFLVTHSVSQMKKLHCQLISISAVECFTLTTQVLFAQLICFLPWFQERKFVKFLCWNGKQLNTSVSQTTSP